MKSNFVYFILIFCAIFYITPTIAQYETGVQLKWLGENAPSLSTGVSWGVPFAKGQVQANSNYLLSDANANNMPLQTWPMAYWPDGSLKWIGLSTIVNAESGSTFQLQPINGKDEEKGNQKINLENTKDAYIINTGILQCTIPRQGKQLIRSIKINNSEVSSGSELVCILQNGPDKEIGVQPTREKFTGKIESVSIEQEGPVRCVVKIEGNYISEDETRSFLPFIIRLYFYAGQQSIKIVHTITYDGDQNQDFIRGLGLVFNVPLDEEIYNRHVRFSGENNGFWSEPVQPLTGRRKLDNNNLLYSQQLIGKRIPQRETFSKTEKFLIENWVEWNDFKLFQGNANGFIVQKRTNNLSTWINAGAGKRSSGLAFVGDVSGGLTVCIRDFWKSFPSALEVRDAKTSCAKLKAWLWSPDGPAMDLRHYDTVAFGHNLDASYEDVQPGYSTPTGIARTSEILLFASSEVPSMETLKNISHQGNQPALLTATTEYLHSIPVFGVWSLPDRSTTGKQWIENKLDDAFEYYKLEVDQRNWYGFWDYGDIMHSYDSRRHSWNYDIGGYAWDNTELMPNLWLWYTFLRSGREDVFRMAEAMTRHTSEVDVYHLGRFDGLGSRHNVRHWGCGAKEVRISQAALNRFYYYLSTDERTGDLMHASVEKANTAIGKNDPLRLILKNDNTPTHARIGPDWLALVGNWMTEWERTGDTIYRNRIMIGVESFYDMPYGFYSGKRAAFGYNPQTYELSYLNKKDIGFSHLSVLMGGPEVAFELTTLLNNKKWDKLLLQFCKLYGAPSDSVKKELGRRIQLGTLGSMYARLPAYYSMTTANNSYAKIAWNNFLGLDSNRVKAPFEIELVESNNILEPVYEIKNVSTNYTAQWCLNAIELLELIGNQLPESHPCILNDEN